MLRRSGVAVLLSFVLLGAGCASNGSEARALEQSPSSTTPTSTVDAAQTTAERTTVRTGAAVAASTDFARWQGNRVGLIASQTSVVEGTHLVDLLARSGNVELVALFGPEHGIRSDADAGEYVADSIDAATGIVTYSLYGETREPIAEMLAGIDVLFYDLQDVGARYYSYISTMGLAMRAAAANDITFVVLDRPNPLGGAVAGSVLQPDQVSFVGQYPITDVYGLTSGELANAIVGEGWFDRMDGLDLEVVEMEGWDRSMRWADTGLAWIPPSPAITNPDTALIYPATVLLEATTLSYGRGTNMPFEIFGAPWLDGGSVAAALNSLPLPGVSFESQAFTPANSGQFTEPPAFAGEPMNGVRIRVTDTAAIEPVALGLHILDAIIDASPDETVIARPEWLDRLTGSTRLRDQLDSGRPAAALIPALRIESELFATLTTRYYRYP